MKKIFIKVNVVLIGSENSGLSYLVNLLEELNLYSSNEEDSKEYLIIHDQVPLKLVLNMLNNVKEFGEIQKEFDALILVLDLYESNHVDSVIIDQLKEHLIRLDFRGIGILLAMDLPLIKDEPLTNIPRMSRPDLIRLTNDLNFIYCFEIQNERIDLLEVLKRIFDDLLFKYQYSSPELFDQAKEFGKELSKQYIFTEE